MRNCGSGSYFGKGLVPAPVPVPVQVPVPAPVQVPLPAPVQVPVPVQVQVPVPAPVLVPDPDLFNTDFNNNIFLQNLAFSLLEEALFPRKLASNLGFFTFVLHFMSDPGPNPVPEPERITVPVPLRQKLRFLRLRFHNTDSHNKTKYFANCNSKYNENSQTGST